VVAVKVATVEVGSVERSFGATGRVGAQRQEKVYAPVSGTLLRLDAVEGESVSRGAVVATIRTKESQAQINGARTLLASARTPEEKAEAERTLRLAVATDNAATVRAPIGGIVTTRSAGQGELVAEGAELFSILDPSTLVFMANVPLAMVASARPGTPCRVRLDALPDQELAAVIAATSPQSDAQSQTVPARLRFVSLPSSIARLLKTDMAGTASIITGRHAGALLVPKRAVLRNDETGTSSVVIVGADSLAHIVEVEPGPARDSTTMAVSGDGLAPGMRVIVEGHYALADSTRVTVVR
jgi:RND family efflux transporter MFP subunit